jgi:GcrA cell cycle regulator
VGILTSGMIPRASWKVFVMGWTDERVELLKKLWQAGLSANQIAKELGGVSRNACIGKVHRLGLCGRATPSKPTRTTFKAPRPQPKPISVAPSVPRRIAEPVFASEPIPLPVRYVEEAPGTATILTLGSHMCKWPIGDPESNSFTFCGRRSSCGPYCYEHDQVAHQPAHSRKRSSANDLARSLRRYI